MPLKVTDKDLRKLTSEATIEALIERIIEHQEKQDKITEGLLKKLQDFATQNKKLISEIAKSRPDLVKVVSSLNNSLEEITTQIADNKQELNVQVNLDDLKSSLNTKGIENKLDKINKSFDQTKDWNFEVSRDMDGRIKTIRAKAV